MENGRIEGKFALALINYTQCSRPETLNFRHRNNYNIDMRQNWDRKKLKFLYKIVLR